MPSAVRTILFVLLAALAATSVLASPLLGVLSATRTKTTNADLLARGQTPKRPKQLFNPSRPRASLPRQSSVPAQNAAIQITPYYDGVPARRTEKRDTAPARFVQVDTQNGNIFADSTPATFILPSSSAASTISLQVELIQTNVFTGVTQANYYYAGAYGRRKQSDTSMFSHIAFGIFNNNVDSPGSFETTMWAPPTIGAAVEIHWTDAQGNTLPLNYYIDSSDGNRLVAAQSASDINAVLTEADRVSLTWGPSSATAAS